MRSNLMKPHAKTFIEKANELFPDIKERLTESEKFKNFFKKYALPQNAPIQMG